MPGGSAIVAVPFPGVAFMSELPNQLSTYPRRGYTRSLVGFVLAVLAGIAVPSALRIASTII